MLRSNPQGYIWSVRFEAFCGQMISNTPKLSMIHFGLNFWIAESYIRE